MSNAWTTRAAITRRSSARPSPTAQPDQGGPPRVGYGSPTRPTPPAAHTLFATAPHFGAIEAELNPARRWMELRGQLRGAPAGLRPLGAKAISRGQAAEPTVDRTLATYRTSTQLEAAEFESDAARLSCPRAGNATLAVLSTPVTRAWPPPVLLTNCLMCDRPQPARADRRLRRPHPLQPDTTSRMRASFQKVPVKPNPLFCTSVCAKHAMAGDLNGIAYHGSWLIPYGGHLSWFAGYMVGPCASRPSPNSG